MEKNYNENRDKNPDQIIKKFGKDVFIEVIQPNDQFERVTVNLVSLCGAKQKEKISCYVDMDEWLTLCNRIATGRFGMYVEDAKRACANNNGFPPELWKKQGGKATPNGAWMLSIHPATKGSNAVMIKAQRGAGEAMSNGLIKFIYNRNNPQVMIGLTHEMLEDIAQHVVCGHFSGNVAQVVDTFAKVLADEVTREAGMETVDDAVDGGEGGSKCFVVAEVAHDG